MGAQKRWILLEHTGAPDDPEGIHFDLMVEDNHGCRSWRLNEIPRLDGPAQGAIPLPVHQFKWLDHLDGEVSRGRGHARRVMAGFFFEDLPENDSEPVEIQLHSNGIIGKLTIKNFLCTLSSISSSSFIP